jgi:putative FmdB family regulatory protein
MPTYEYQCDACKFRFERFQPITAKPIRKCPKCGKSKVKRLISAGGGMIFKGSGFYITDYRDSKYKESAKADSAPAADSTAGKSDKTDKPAQEPAKQGGGDAKESAPDAPKPAEAAPAKSKSTKPAKSGK